jgi:DnaJ-class molecular chaperone
MPRHASIDQVTQRTPCPECSGAGTVLDVRAEANPGDRVTCPICSGLGMISDSQARRMSKAKYPSLAGVPSTRQYTKTRKEKAEGI